MLSRLSGQRGDHCVKAILKAGDERRVWMVFRRLERLMGEAGVESVNEEGNMNP